MLVRTCSLLQPLPLPRAPEGRRATERRSAQSVGGALRPGKPLLRWHSSSGGGLASVKGPRRKQEDARKAQFPLSQAGCSTGVRTAVWGKTGRRPSNPHPFCANPGIDRVLPGSSSLRSNESQPGHFDKLHWANHVPSTRANAHVPCDLACHFGSESFQVVVLFDLFLRRQFAATSSFLTKGRGWQGVCLVTGEGSATGCLPVAPFHPTGLRQAGTRRTDAPTRI